MSCSWLSFVMGPQLQIGNLQTVTNIVVGGAGRVYPNAEIGQAHQGAEIYRANGCAACHTQQVRPSGLGSDLSRGWGVRRSTAEDYIFTDPVLLGTMRIGPDLANAGKRMDMNAVLLHLYEPKIFTRNSVMPSFAFLFDKHQIKGYPSPSALPLSEPSRPPSGWEVTPTTDAIALANYVTSLHQDGYLFEAPPPYQPAAKTNAPPVAMPK